jgi:hypothetical protein
MKKETQLRIVVIIAACWIILVPPIWAESLSSRFAYSAPSDDGKGLESGAEAWAMARGVTPSRRRIARAM